MACGLYCDYKKFSLNCSENLYTTTQVPQQQHHRFTERKYLSSGFLQNVILVMVDRQSQCRLLIPTSIKFQTATQLFHRLNLKQQQRQFPNMIRDVTGMIEACKLEEKGWAEHALQKLNEEDLTSADAIV